MTKLRIHIGSIGETGEKVDEQLDARQLPLLSGFGEKEQIHFTRPVRVHIHATMVGEAVLIVGKVQTVVGLVCSRCLEPFDLAVEAEFSTTAQPDTPPMEGQASRDEIELTADELDAITYQGEIIDLREEIGQQILMALPFRALCRETCKGICSHCGVDLNRASCRCRRQDESNPFAVLKILSLPPKKD